jgi:transcriptional regulator of nitric oxide reductase
VRIVNQSVLGAALEVARAKLGFAARSKRGPPAQVLPEINDPVSFAAMLQNGMVGRLRLSNAEVEKLFAGTDGAQMDEEALTRPDDVFVDLYIAYLNAPGIGRAILGDAQYKTAMARNFENRHLWWIGTAGRYPLVDENFIPGAQSSRLAMTQDGLFLELRDQGFDPKGVEGSPELNASRLFGVYAEAGLDPGRSLDLALTITRAKGMILPTLTHKQVTLSYMPPATLFFYPPEPLPEWLLAWQQRWLDLTILGSALILLCIKGRMALDLVGTKHMQDRIKRGPFRDVRLDRYRRRIVKTKIVEIQMSPATGVFVDESHGNHRILDRSQIDRHTPHLLAVIADRLNMNHRGFCF